MSEPTIDTGKMKHVALTGYAGVGKDAVGVHSLVETGRYVRVAFGDYIKQDLDLLLKRHLGFSAFTNDPAQKRSVRALMECWGDVNFGRILERLERNIMFLEESGHLVVNARLCRAEEARMWVQNGGIIIEMQRFSIGPASKWEMDRVMEIREAGYIHSAFIMEGNLEVDRRRFKRRMEEIFNNE